MVKTTLISALSATVRVKVSLTCLDGEPLSVAVMVMADDPAAPGMPEMSPEALMPRPVGRPEALKERAFPSGSLK